MNDTNTNKSIYSLSMIELENYELLLEKFQQRYERADFVLNYILSQNSQTEDMKDLLNDYAFTCFASCSRCLKNIRRDIDRDKVKLSGFLAENPKENELFLSKYNSVKAIIDFHERELDSRIAKCFEFNNNLIEENQDLGV